MASSIRRGSIGLDGAESQYCDLSGRRLTSGQIDRTLRVFATADTIDLSNNEIDRVPSSIPAQVVTLDISFNVIASIHGIERLKFVQELHLAFNRLDDVSALEFCPRLVLVNLSGNRLTNTKGLETLEYLENLDVSDNLIEGPEALRPLSLNHNLTHLTIRGNPFSQKPGYHVPLLDIIPSVIMLDDKKMRSAAKYKTKEVSATKSLSYSRIYDDKKQFVIHKQTRPRPGTTVRPLLPGEPATKYDATMFLPPPLEPTHERARAGIQKYHMPASTTLPPAPALQSPVKARATPYLSLYDRLAQSNGIPVNRSCAPPSKPIASPASITSKVESTPTTKMNSNQHDGTQNSVGKPSSENTRGGTSSRHPTPSRSSIANREPWQDPQQRQRRPSVLKLSASAKPGASTATHGLDEKQRNVLGVIQNLIQHKRQTLATLGSQKPGADGMSSRSQGHNFASRPVR